MGKKKVDGGVEAAVMMGIKRKDAIAAMAKVRALALAKPPAGWSEHLVSGDTVAGKVAAALANAKKVAVITIIEDGGKITSSVEYKNMDKPTMVFALEATKASLINGIKVEKVVTGPRRRSSK